MLLQLSCNLLAQKWTLEKIYGEQLYYSGTDQSQCERGLGGVLHRLCTYVGRGLLTDQCVKKTRVYQGWQGMAYSLVLWLMAPGKTGSTTIQKRHQV